MDLNVRQLAILGAKLEIARLDAESVKVQIALDRLQRVPGTRASAKVRVVKRGRKAWTTAQKKAKAASMRSYWKKRKAANKQTRKATSVDYVKS